MWKYQVFKPEPVYLSTRGSAFKCTVVLCISLKMAYCGPK